MPKKTNSIQEIAMGLLSRREHSRYELQQKLKQRGFEDVDIQDTLDQFCQKDWQSDERFAGSYVAMRTRRGYGPLRIRQELQARQVDDALIAQHLPHDDAYWTEQAAQVRAKKFGKAMPSDFALCAKQKRFLYQRGFSGYQAQQVFRGD